MQQGAPERESHWTESNASGSKSFIEEVKNSLKFKAKGKSITDSKDRFQLRKNVLPFDASTSQAVEATQGSDAGPTNTFDWREIS